MAGATINHKPLCCKSCAAYNRLSLTLEWCDQHKAPVFAKDRACPLFINASPWLNWAIDGPVSAEHVERRENDR